MCGYVCVCVCVYVSSTDYFEKKQAGIRAVKFTK